MIKTRKNKKNNKRRNKRSDIKITGKPREYRNHIEYDFVVNKLNNKSRKINGGGDFIGEACDITPLDRMPDIPMVQELNLSKISSSGVFSGTYNTATYVECAKNAPIFFPPKLALRVYKYPVKYDPTTNNYLFFEDGNRDRYNTHKSIDDELTSTIYKEYELQIKLYLLGQFTPPIYSICMVDNEYLRSLLVNPVNPFKLSYSKETTLYNVCAVMRQIKTISSLLHEGRIDPLSIFHKMIELIDRFSQSGVFLDIKPGNTGVLDENCVFIDVDGSFSALFETLGGQIVDMEKSKEFCKNVMKYIFFYFIIYFYKTVFTQRESKIIYDTFLLPLVTNEEFLFEISLLYVYNGCEKSLLYTLLFKEILDAYLFREDIQKAFAHTRFAQTHIIGKYLVPCETSEMYRLNPAFVTQSKDDRYNFLRSGLSAEAMDHFLQQNGISDIVDRCNGRG